MDTIRGRKSVCYTRTIDYTLLPALNSLASQQSQPTEKTREIAWRIMGYSATYLNIYIFDTKQVIRFLMWIVMRHTLWYHNQEAE